MNKPLSKNGKSEKAVNSWKKEKMFGHKRLIIYQVNDI